MSEKRTTPKRPPSRIARSSASPTCRNTAGLDARRDVDDQDRRPAGLGQRRLPSSARSASRRRGEQRGDARGEAEPERPRRSRTAQKLGRVGERKRGLTRRPVPRRRRGVPSRPAPACAARPGQPPRAQRPSPRSPTPSSRASRSSERRRSAVSSPRRALPAAASARSRTERRSTSTCSSSAAATRGASMRAEPSASGRRALPGGDQPRWQPVVEAGRRRGAVLPGELLERGGSSRDETASGGRRRSRAPPRSVGPERDERRREEKRRAVPLGEAFRAQALELEAVTRERRPGVVQARRDDAPDGAVRIEDAFRRTLADRPGRSARARRAGRGQRRRTGRRGSEATLAPPRPGRPAAVDRRARTSAPRAAPHPASPPTARSMRARRVTAVPQGSRRAADQSRNDVRIPSGSAVCRTT